LAFGASLGAGTLPFGFIPSFQLLETLKPICGRLKNMDTNV
jgi:hypothetical protein